MIPTDFLLQVLALCFFSDCGSLFQIQRNTTPMYRAPEMIDLYSNHPINEKADIWVIRVSNSLYTHALIYQTYIVKIC